MMATDSDIPESVRDSRWEAEFQPNPSYPSQIVNTQYAGRRVIRQEFWTRERRLGHGGFGVVWLEKVDSTSRSQVGLRAVKELRLSQKDDRRRQCIRELEALVKFSQKKFVGSFLEFYGWFESRDALFIATEYCQFGDLKQFVKEYGSIAEPHVQAITEQVLQGIIFMHDNNFAHRDLKPANILVKQRPPNHDWHVKIGDMGLSKRIGTEVTSTTVKGTPGFIAPERIPGIGPNPTGVDPFPCDIWCLGEVSFFLLTGGTTFDNLLDLQGYANNTIDFPQERLDTIGASVPAKDFVRLLMAARPSERPSATEADSHVWMTSLNDTPDLLHRWMAGISIEQTTSSRLEGTHSQSIAGESVTIPSGTWNSTTQPMAHVQLPSRKVTIPSVEDTRATDPSRTKTSESIPASSQQPWPSTIGHDSTNPHPTHSKHAKVRPSSETPVGSESEDGASSDDELPWPRAPEPVKRLEAAYHLPELARSKQKRTRKYVRDMRLAILYMHRKGSRLVNFDRRIPRTNDETSSDVPGYNPSDLPPPPSPPPGGQYDLPDIYEDLETMSLVSRTTFGSSRSDQQDRNDPPHREYQDYMDSHDTNDEERSRRSDRSPIPESAKEQELDRGSDATGYKPPTVEDAEDSDY